MEYYEKIMANPEKTENHSLCIDSIAMAEKKLYMTSINCQFLFMMQ